MPWRALQSLDFNQVKRCWWIPVQANLHSSCPQISDINASSTGRWKLENADRHVKDTERWLCWYINQLMQRSEKVTVRRALVHYINIYIYIYIYRKRDTSTLTAQPLLDWVLKGLLKTEVKQKTSTQKWDNMWFSFRGPWWGIKKKITDIKTSVLPPKHSAFLCICRSKHLRTPARNFTQTPPQPSNKPVGLKARQ